MPVTCQYCGTEAPDDRVMCPNCRRRLRSADGGGPEAAAAESTLPDGYGVTPGQPADSGGYGATPATPWASPTPTSSEPPRPQVLFARDVITKSNRLTVAFRIFLAIPQVIVVFALLIAMYVVAIIAWFAALFTARVPDGMHEFIVNVLRYQVRVSGYVTLLTDRYPPFSLQPGGYPIEYSTTHENLNRAAVFFRIILAIPAYVLAYFVRVGSVLGSIVSWFIILIRGRMPQPLFDAGANVLRYGARFDSYFLLVTPAYPAGLFRDPSSETYGEEVDTSAPEPPRQTPGAKRLIVAFLCIGAASWVASFSFGVFAGVKEAQALNDLRKAHNTVVREVSLPDCPTGADQLQCLTKHAGQDAAAFHRFGDKLKKIHVRSGASFEKAQLATTTESLFEAFDALSKATSLPQYGQIAASQNVTTLLNDWDSKYSDLDDAFLKND